MKKICFLLLVAATVIFSENGVSITGTVQNSRTNEPVADAKVTLVGLGIFTTTKTDGTFSISGTSLLQNRWENSGSAPLVEASALLYRHDMSGPALIRIVDLSGKQQTEIFSGTLANGIWKITPPQLSPGIYLCTFDTPKSHYAVRFLASVKTTAAHPGAFLKLVDGFKSSSASLHKGKASSPVDSLLVEKSGYRSVYQPLNAYQEASLTILLEDTTSTDTDDATIIPDESWTCFMPEGIPPPELGEEVFSIVLKYSAIHDVGITKFGDRRQFDISSGTIKGDKIDGTVLTGGLDYELTLSNGSMEIEQIVILKAGNSHILMRNAGVAPTGAKWVRVVLDFEAPNSSSYAWLHDSKFSANRVIDSTAKTITLDVYDITDVALTESRITIKDPEGVENQTWDCLKWSGSQGATVFTENCKLGSSISIGATKRGSRNIIPITGGTTTGKVTGKILPGGADFQLSGIDARYTLAPDDGEFIIIRNCGSGALIPVFEARVDGPYNFLNENKYLSSAPGMGSGGVSITFYEKQ